MKALVTGATGFVGSALVRKLLKQGIEVRLTSRSNSDRANINDLPATVEQVSADLNDSDSMKKALTGCDSLFHVAADYRLWTRHPQQMIATNVTATRNLMLQALDLNLSRIVYTSSVATLKLNADKSPSTEKSIATVDDMIGLYKRSKFLAEQEVEKLIKQQDLPAVIVSPSTPIGPRDVRPTPTGKMVADAVAGKMPAYVNTGLNIVHVDDVAEGHLLAYKHGKIGERYILGGENMTLKDILTFIAIKTNQKPPTICLPHSVVLPIAYLSEAYTRLTGGDEPKVSVDGVRMSKKWMYFSSDKAKQELRYSPRPAVEALSDAVLWFQNIK
ncbi:MAG: hopanoid-associated sugar epimerase [Thiohalomonadales bacterium]